MGYHETNYWLQVFKDCEIILYCHYVGDIICLFNSESDVDKFYEFLNKQHSDIGQILMNPIKFESVIQSE